MDTNKHVESLRDGDNVLPIIMRIAEECLSAMESIAAAATSKAGERIAGPGTVLGSYNSVNDTGAGRVLSDAQEWERKAGYELAREPLISRVKTRTEDGLEKTFYFARNFTTTVPGIKLTSYNSGAPVGRLASLEVGDEFELPGGEIVEVIEKGIYTPSIKSGQWDGIDNRIEHESFEEMLVPSLRQAGKADLLGSTALDDPFAGLDAPIIWAKPRRAALSGVGLRDQSVMNKVQDEIFRLPIDRRVMLEGPPGTGKTTTLIKRLSQKLVLNDEREEDYRAIIENQLGGEHANSWIMFSPTPLLEHYLREAFARDNVPASQDRIQTWTDFRNRLATQVLGILRSGKRTGGFLRDDEAENLSAYALRNQHEFHAAFDRMQRALYHNELDAALATLAESGEPTLEAVARRVRSRLAPSGAASLLSIYLEVDSNSEDMRRWVAETRAAITDEVNRRIEVLARLRPNFVDEARRLVGRIDSDVSIEDDIDADEEDALEVEGEAVTTKERLLRVMRASIRAMSMAAWNKRQVPRTSKFIPIIKFLGEDVLPIDALARMGRQHALIAAVQMITLTTRNYFTRLPQRYRAFRKAAPAPWFHPEAADAVKISPPELDLLVVIQLEAAVELLASQQVRGNLTQGNLLVLAPILGEFRNQVVVDEATDFTPLQLRAMYCIATPGIHSFFACGDFNQRLTRYGVTSREALEWAVPGLEFRHVEIAYRQSEELRIFANQIVALAGGILFETLLEGPRSAEGHAPVVNVSTNGSTGQSSWIAERIIEIDQIHKELPSIAVFVPDGNLVTRVADELALALKETNIEVMPCPGGQVLGRDRNVRIFAVEHIKGLEFEAAFFHSLQDLARDAPDLFDKFLYVGATRAATFLGLSAEGRLPPLLEQATAGLGHDWSAVKRNTAGNGSAIPIQNA